MEVRNGKAGSLIIVLLKCIKRYKIGGTDHTERWVQGALQKASHIEARHAVLLPSGYKDKRKRITTQSAYLCKPCLTLDHTVLGKHFLQVLSGVRLDHSSDFLEPPEDPPCLAGSIQDFPQYRIEYPKPHPHLYH